MPPVHIFLWLLTVLENKFDEVFDATNMPHVGHTLVSNRISKYHENCETNIKSMFQRGVVAQFG